VCDLTSGAGNGQCVEEGNIVYVDLRDTGNFTCVDGDGSSANPYCQITTGLTNLGARHFVHVGTGIAHYAAVVATTSLSAYLVGPGPSAAPILDVDANGHAVEEIAADNQTIDLTFDGFEFVGISNHTNVYCDATALGSSTITVRNSIVEGGFYGVRIINCNGTVTESLIRDAAGVGVLLDNLSRYDFHNDIISGSVTAGLQTVATSAGGNFSFNTLSFNGADGATAGGAICGRVTPLDDCIIAGNGHTPDANGSQFSDPALCVLNGVATGPDTLTLGAVPSPSPVFRSYTAPYDLRLLVDDAPSGPHTAANRGCCIDKVPGATPSPSPLPAIDFEHEARPKGPAWDVGADEAL
jgi:hypothetical protein